MVQMKDMSRITLNEIHADFNEHHEMTPRPLVRNTGGGMVIKCPRNSASPRDEYSNPKPILKKGNQLILTNVIYALT